LKHGRHCFSFYKSVNKYGQTQTFWTLTRDTPKGRVRLATGRMEDFREIRAATLRSLNQNHEPTQARATKPLAQSVRPTMPEKTKAPAEGPRPEQARVEAPLKQQPKATDEAKPKRRDRWYSVVLDEGLKADGYHRVRVVRSFSDYRDALAAARANPKLFF